jgi:hypothetical protein
MNARVTVGCMNASSNSWFDSCVTCVVMFGAAPYNNYSNSSSYESSPYERPPSQPLTGVQSGGG